MYWRVWSTSCAFTPGKDAATSTTITTAATTTATANLLLLMLMPPSYCLFASDTLAGLSLHARCALLAMLSKVE